MKVSDLIDKIEAWGNKRWGLWSIWGLYSLLVIALCYIHEPWCDEYKVWSMVYRLSIPELWDAMREEGHFCLWHLCVWPWVNIFGMDYHALFVASSLLMSGAVWLLLFKLEFSFIGKLFIIFSSPFFYYFPVVARCYALIPPILIAIAITYQKQKNPFLYCFLIGILAHTHAYMEGMVGILWCLFIYYYVYIPYKHGELQRAKKNGWASLITIVLVLLAFVQIMGGITDAAKGTSVAMMSVNAHTNWVMGVYQRHHIQLTTTLHNQVNSLIPKIDLPITLFLYVTITILLYKIIHLSTKKTECKWIVYVSIIYQILFAINIYCMWFQRVYLLYLPILYITWITYNNDKDIKRYATYVVICFWLLNTPAQYDILHDITKEYCFDVSVTKQLDKSITNNYPIISYAAESSWLMEKEVIFINSRKDSLEDVLQNICPKDSVLNLITSHDLSNLSRNNFTIEKKYSGIQGNNDFTGEGYRLEIGLYTLTRHAKIH